MSELLLRRRALEAINADGAEGGGTNDGKNVVILNRQGWNTWYRHASVDFGESFNLYTTPNIAYTASAELDSLGGLYMPSRSLARLIRAEAPNSTTTADVYFRTASGAGTGGSIAYAKAVQVSSDMSRILTLHGSSYSNYTTIKLFDMTSSVGAYRTGSTLIQTSTNIPAHMTAQACGPLFEANKDTLQHVIIGKFSQQRWGQTAAIGSISHDWGLTWNNIAENIEGVSHSIDDTATAKLGSVAWSADGKYCGVIYNSKFYLSQDSGYHFTSMSCPETPRGIFGSQKFKTLYFTSVSGSVYRSRDRGKTWTQILQKPLTNSSAIACLTVNDAGDKLCTWWHTGSGWTSYVSYSHDYGNTWTASKSGSTVGFRVEVSDGTQISWRYFGSSRDHVNL